MKIIIASITIVACVLFLSFATFATPPERFWISFSRPFGDKYVMQIDALGNVIMLPQKISEVTGAHPSGATALSTNGNSALNLWFTSLKFGRIFRVAVDKKTLKTLRLVRTPLIVSNISLTSLDVTHRTENNFISFLVETNEGTQLAAYPLDQYGRVIGKRTLVTPPLSPSCVTRDCSGGIVPNARLAYWIDVNPTKFREVDLFIRRVGPLGNPISDPVQIDRIFSQTARGPWTFAAADATVLLPDNRRFFVYIKAPPAELLPQRIILQTIDINGVKLGDPITIYKTVDLGFDIEIDPFGRFVLFIDGGLRYLSLDATGHPSGEPRLLEKKAAGAIDLLREAFQ